MIIGIVVIGKEMEQLIAPPIFQKATSPDIIVPCRLLSIGDD